MRERIADNVHAICAQRLMPRADGKGQALAVELLVMTKEAKETIRRPEGNMPLKDIMANGARPHGMTTFDIHIRELVKAGRVSVEAARNSMS